MLSFPIVTETFHSTTSFLPITVRFGTTMVTTAIIYHNEEYYIDDDPSPSTDTCPNSTVYCDGIKDCQLGTDETNCGEYNETTHSLTTGCGNHTKVPLLLFKQHSNTNTSPLGGKNIPFHLNTDFL